MMRLFLFISGLLLCASAQAMEWKSDITLSPQPMTYSGPADSVVPGSIIGSTERLRQRTTGVLVWVCFHCTKSTLEPSSSAISSGMTVTVDGVNYTILKPAFGRGLYHRAEGF